MLFIFRFFTFLCIALFMFIASRCWILLGVCVSAWLWLHLIALFSHSDRPSIKQPRIPSLLEEIHYTGSRICPFSGKSPQDCIPKSQPKNEHSNDHLNSRLHSIIP